jgi:hypothetical protein
MYVLWWREHNYWCDYFHKRSTVQEGEEREGEEKEKGMQIFRLAKQIVIAEMQAITYREFLPTILSEGSTDALQSSSPDIPFYISDKDLHRCFPNVQELYIPIDTPEQFNSGTTSYYQKVAYNLTLFEEYVYGAGQLYQTLMVDYIDLFHPHTNTITIPSNVLLSDTDFLNRHALGLDSILLSASMQLSSYRDTCICRTARNLSLMTTQKAEHISYQAAYYHMTGMKYPHCMRTLANPDICRLGRENGLHYHTFNIFFGILAEKNLKFPANSILEHATFSFLGEVAQYIFRYQFAQIKQNDYYFYLWDETIRDYRSKIHNTRLSTIILRHTTIKPEYLHPNVFLVSKRR